MKRKQITAILMSAIMTVSACMPMNSMQAMAAENAGASGTAAEAAVTAEQPDEAQDTGESEEPQVIEPETPAPTVTGDENGENSGNSASAEDTGDKNGAASEDATVGDTGDADEGSIEVAEVGNSEITEIGVTDAAAEEEAAQTSDGLGKDAIEETEEETAKKDAKKLEDPTNEDFANAVDISCGDTWDVVLNSEHPFEMYRFTPEQSGRYTITSFSDGDNADNYVELYDDNHNCIESNDDHNGSSLFELNSYLEQGNTYYYRVRMYYEDGEGGFTVSLTKSSLYVEDTYHYVHCAPGESVTLSVNAISDNPITYSWHDDAGETLNCTDESYTFIPERNTYYYCTVQSGDESAEVSFEVYIYNNMSLEGSVDGYELSDDGYYYLTAGQSASLHVEASAIDTTGITYKWFEEDEELEDAADASITTDPISRAVSYRCEVTDRYGEMRTIYFNLSIQNNLQAYVKGKEGVTEDYLFVTEGESLTLEVTATADDMEGLTYHWTDENHEYDEEHPEKYAGASYVIESAGSCEEYVCGVTDKYGTYKYVRFCVNPDYIDNNLRAYVLTEDEYGEYKESSESVAIPAGESRTLSFNVEAQITDSLTYSWFYSAPDDEDYEELAQTEEPKYTVDANGDHYKAGDYKGVVRDQFGNEASVVFYVRIENDLHVYDPANEYAYSSDHEVEYGTSLTLQAAVEARNLSGATYRWKELTNDGYRTIAEGNLEGNTISYEIPSVTGKMGILCDVTDAYGNEESHYYDVIVRNRWTAYPNGTISGRNYIDLMAAPEGSMTLKVNIKADAEADLSQLQFDWYMYTYNEEDDEIRVVLEADEGHPDQYTVPSVTGRTSIYCGVRDQFDNYEEVSFHIRVDSGLEVSGSSTPEGEIHYEKYTPFIYVYVPYGGNVTLKANATTQSGNGEVRYEWMDYDNWDYLDENSSELTLTNVTSRQSYRCVAADAYGNEEAVYYRIFIQNHLQAYAQNAENGDTAYILAAPGTQMTLQAIIEADDRDGLSIRWYDDDWEEFANDTESVTVDAKRANYHCSVEDKYGNFESLGFKITIDNEFEAYPEGAELDAYGNHESSVDIEAQSGEALQLNVIASAANGSLTYSWQEKNQYITSWGEYEYDFKDIEGNGSSLAVSAVKATAYKCLVEDEYGNEKEVTFNIHMGSLLAYPEGAAAGTDGSYPDRIAINVDEGENVTLRVLTEASEGAELSYKWTEGPLNDSGWWPLAEGVVDSNDTLAITATESNRYMCAVTDQYGNNKCVYFYVYVDGMTLSSNQGTPVLTGDSRYDLDVTVKYGGEIDLQTIVEAKNSEDISFAWYVYKYYGSFYDYVPLNDTDDTVTVVGGDYESYRCKVIDANGNKLDLYYHIQVDNELSVRPEGADEGTNSVNVKAQEGDDLVLRTLVSALDDHYFEYEWYDSKGRKVGNGQNLPVHVTADTTYRCEVTDAYDNVETAYFHILTGDDVISISDAQITLSEDSYVYDGTAKTPQVTVTYDGAELIQDTDYTVEYKNNVNAGTAQVVVRGRELYSGTIQETFEIQKASQTIRAQDVSVEVGGTAKINVTGAVTAVSFASGNTSVATVAADGTVTGKNVGTAAVTVTANGSTNYEEAATSIQVTVTPISLKDEDVALATTEFTYNGEEQKPGLTVVSGGKTLAVDRDYTVEFGESTNAGDKTVTIKGIGNYTGNVTKSYTIKKAAQTISAQDVSIVFSETAQAVVAGAATSVTYESQNTAIATVTADGTVTGTGAGSTTINVTAAGNSNYELAVTTFTVTVDPISLSDTSKVAVSLSDTAFTYNGSEQKPVITVVCNGAPLTAGNDYEVSFSGESTNAGEYSVTITGKGNYDGSVTEGYRILKAVQVLSANSLRMKQGDSAKIVVTGAQTDVTFTSRNDSIASVAADGTVTGIGTGETVITVAAAGNDNYEPAAIDVDVTVIDRTLIDLNQAVITLDQEEFTYDGNAKEPNVSVIVDGNEISEGFTVEYVNNTDAWEPEQGDGGESGSEASGAVAGASAAGASGADAGADSSVDDSTSTENAPKVVITGDGEIATGVVEIPFVIHKAEQKVTISPATVSLDAGKTAKVTVNGAIGKTGYSVASTKIAKVTSFAAVANKEGAYAVTISGVAVGTTKVTVTAAGDRNHKPAVATSNVKVRPKATTSLKAEPAANGKGIKLTWAKVAGATNYVIYCNNKKLTTTKNGTTVAFTDAKANTNGAKYTYKVYAKAATGTSSQYKSAIYYKLNRPATPTATNSASRKMTVKWAKNAKANGYQVQYSLKSNFSGAKGKSVSKNSIVSTVIGSLTKGKIYYVRVRSYKKVSGKTYYSAWSATRKIKITK